MNTAKIYTLNGGQPHSMPNLFLQQKIRISTREHLELLNYDEINYLQADSNYTIFNLINGQKRITSQCLKSYLSESLLCEFIKVHRKYIVRLDQIRIWNRVNSELILINGDCIPVSRTRRKDVERLLQ